MRVSGSVRVILVAILSCNCEATQTRRNIKLVFSLFARSRQTSQHTHSKNQAVKLILIKLRAGPIFN